jgi:hypothetical protein
MIHVRSTVQSQNKLNNSEISSLDSPRRPLVLSRKTTEYYVSRGSFNSCVYFSKMYTVCKLANAYQRIGINLKTIKCIIGPINVWTISKYILTQFCRQRCKHLRRLTGHRSRRDRQSRVYVFARSSTKEKSEFYDKYTDSHPARVTRHRIIPTAVYIQEGSHELPTSSRTYKLNRDTEGIRIVYRRVPTKHALHPLKICANWTNLHCVTRHIVES